MMTTSGRRAIEDTMTALVCHGVLTRFPTLREQGPTAMKNRPKNA
jgi:hypothetical protein